MQWTNFVSSFGRGKAAEDLACQHLQKKGLTLIEKNYRCRTGEIDLIMQQGSELVFVEVKFRTNKDFGSASEFLTKHKRKKLVSAIQHYLMANHLNPAVVAHRLDLIAIDKDQLEWFPSV